MPSIHLGFYQLMLSLLRLYNYKDITPGAAAVPSLHHSLATGSTGRGGRQPIVLNDTFISQLDGREVARNQRRYAFDGVGGAM